MRAMGCGLSWNLGSLSGKGDVCENIRKKMIDMCCLLEVRWRGQGGKDAGMKGRRYKLLGLEKEMELVVWGLW